MRFFFVRKKNANVLFSTCAPAPLHQLRIALQPPEELRLQVQPVKLDVKDNRGKARRCEGKLLLRNASAEAVEWNSTLLKGTDVARLRFNPPRGTGEPMTHSCLVHSMQ